MTSLPEQPLQKATLIVGILMLVCSIVMLWYSERGQVKLASFASEARKECREVDIDFPREKDDYWLVHAKG